MLRSLTLHLKQPFEPDSFADVLSGAGCARVFHGQCVLRCKKMQEVVYDIPVGAIWGPAKILTGFFASPGPADE